MTLEEKMIRCGTTLATFLRAKKQSKLRPIDWRASLRRRAGKDFAAKVAKQSHGHTLVEEALLLVHVDPTARRLPSQVAPAPDVELNETDLAQVQALERDPVAMASLAKAISAIGQSRPKPIQPAVKPVQPPRELTGLERVIAAFKSQSKRK
jgi:hypothetical protein